MIQVAVISYNTVSDQTMMSVVNTTIPLPAGPALGVGWDEVNNYIYFLNNFTTIDCEHIEKRIGAAFVAIQDISNHTGRIVDLPSRTVATLNPMGYDTFARGPKVGGLNGQYLTASNPFACNGVRFGQVKPDMLEFMEGRLQYYEQYRETAPIRWKIMWVNA